jgi:hypothetical protein
MDNRKFSDDPSERRVMVNTRVVQQALFSLWHSMGFRGSYEAFMNWLKGTPGKDGINGIDGRNGSDGINGKDGKDGRDGTNGKDGLNGKDGERGKDGTNGTNGLDGKNGIDGKQGEKGEKGSPTSFVITAAARSMTSIALLGSSVENIDITFPRSLQNVDYQTAVVFFGASLTILGNLTFTITNKTVTGCRIQVRNTGAVANLTSVTVHVTALSSN